MESLKETELGKPAVTVRELMNRHSQNAQCFSCHGVMDPLGFALENFDAVGQYRRIDRAARTLIDSSGKLPDGSRVDGPDDLRRALVAQPGQFVQTLTEKLMTYGLGRAVEYEDMPAIRAIVRAAAKDDYRFAALVTHIVQSDAFRMTTAPRPAVRTAQGETRQAALPN